jgi:uncharacterized protein involved in type VI secretion and phage assembly
VTTGPGQVQAPTIRANGSNLPDDWQNALFSVSVDQQLCLTGRAVLRFRDDGFVLSMQSTLAIGSDVVVLGGDGVTVFSGVVTAFAVEQRASAGPEVHVTVDDRSHLLALSTDTAAYLRTTYDSVLGQVVRAAGLQLSAAGGDNVSYDYLLQSGTGLDYLNEVAARTGRVWWVEDKTVHLTKPNPDTASVRLTLGEELRSVSVRATGRRPSSIDISSWDSATLAPVTVTASSPSPRAGAPGFEGKPLAPSKTTVRDTRTLTTAESQAVGQAIFDDAVAESIVARGECDFHSAIVPGGVVELAKAGAANANYLLTAVEHLWEPVGGFRTRFVAGPLRPNGLLDLLGNRPRAGFSIGGVLVGVVTNVQDPEHQGRVKLKYATQGDTVESPWARLVTVGAGADRGFEFAPEVGDEVLVAFEEGDTRRPVVLGGLYSQKNAFPGAAKEGNLEGDKIGYRRITSRLGHLVEFADGTGPTTQHILTQLAGGKHKIRLGADKLELVTDQLPVSITNGQATITMAANGDITLEGANVTIKAKANLDLEGSSQVSVKGAQVGVEAQAALKLKGSIGDLEASGPLTVKGATVAIN